jgi:hypothetical protein
MDRGTARTVLRVHPWDVPETLQEVHRRKYYPRASKLQSDTFSVSRWPQVLRAAVDGKADLALSSFGAALFCLQRNLIDAELLCIEADLEDHKNEMYSDVLTPRSLAKSAWKYANTKPENKIKLLIELPVTVAVPDDFFVKGKRGSGHKQVNKYRTAAVQELFDELERALDVQKERKARGMQLIFAKFETKRTLWAAAAQTTALLDALGSLAQVASHA